MPKRPWWLWLATASFVAYWVFLNTSFYYVRESVGFASAANRNGVFITNVTPGKLAARAGMRAGDRLISAYGLPQDDRLDVMLAPAAFPLGVPTEWVVERDGARHTLTLPALHRRWTLDNTEYLLIMAGLLLSLTLGILIAWRGDRRPATLLGAWLLASMGCAALRLWPRSMAAEFRALPIPLIALMWPAAISSWVTPALMFAFCALVPRPMMTARSLAIALTPIAMVTAWVTLSAVLTVHAPMRAASLPLPLWLWYAVPLSYVAYFCASAALLVRSYRRAVDITDRRRVQVLLAGTAAGAIGLLILVGIGLPGVGGPAGPVLTLGGILFAFLPVAFAYATLRHRLFDVRVIVRLGLQYALARGLIAALIPIPLLAMAADIVLHREQPVNAIMAERGWSYALICALIAIVYARRTAWMNALDRRFFRERYAAQQILKDVVDDIGRSDSFEAAAQKVVSRIDSALHPVMTAVMLRPRTATAFSAAARHPDTSRLSSLLSGNAITQVVRALGRPVVFGTQGLRDLPADQQAWLAQSNVEVVVPIAIDASKDEAVLVLGPRRSEEPYSRDDLDLLAAIGASLGLLIGRAPSSEAPTITSISAAPRLANRYRIERPIGEGGMGVVFAAIDETLGRRVAIKVIKDQHLTGGDGPARFQREARTAASLSHPNIVTVHDFGIDDTGSPYLVMELLEGQSLRTAIQTAGRIPPPKAIAILGGMAAALEAAHAKGVIHRDLKPENVFLVGETHAKILDYGIAKAVQSKTTFATPGVLGTLAYMAPEQAGGGDASLAWDVWALSVIAYEMLTGQHPFGGGLPVTRAAPIKTLMPELDDRMTAAIDRALSHTVSDRPASATALIDSLRT